MWNKDKLNKEERRILTQGLIDTASKEEDLMYLKHWLEGYYDYSKSYIPIESKQRFLIMKRLSSTPHRFSSSSQDSIFKHEIELIEREQDDYEFSQ